MIGFGQYCRRTVGALIVAILLAFLIAGCSDDDNESSNEDGAPTATSSPTPEAPDAPPPPDAEIPPAPENGVPVPPVDAPPADSGARAAPGAEAAAASDYLSRSSLACPFLVEGAYIGLPIVGQGLASRYYYRVDGSSWYATNWYYTKDITAWMFNPSSGRWETLPVDASIVILPVGGGQTIDGWELQYDFSTATSQWVNLGSCQTFKEGGIIVN
jgi:hypothetical protein